jgi:exodeoxyribonuclease V alpha subunit
MSAREAVLRRLERQRVLRPLDAELGALVLRLDPAAEPLLGVAAASASLALAQGHSCLPLAEFDEVLAAAAPAGAALPQPAGVEVLRAALRGSGLVGSAADADDARRPLQLDADDRLYLNRYFAYERAVAIDLSRRLSRRQPETDWQVAILRRLLRRHFTLEGAQPDWQALAVLTGLVSPLTVITGGPGTGKTSTVLWLLAVLLEKAHATGADMPRIQLAAPTGKAAARLGELLRERINQMDIHAAVREAMPTAASTLHRLLGVRAGSSRFHHDRDYPLAADIVVVDEASMIDLPLMAKLLDALPETTRLVLLGDRDQLTSVEAGNVLAGICQAAGEGGFSILRAQQIEKVTGCVVPSSPAASPFADAVIELRTSHRFGADSGLAKLAGCIRNGDLGATRAILDDKQVPNVSCTQPANEAAHVISRCGEAFAALALVGTRPMRCNRPRGCAC